MNLAICYYEMPAGSDEEEESTGDQKPMQICVTTPSNTETSLNCQEALFVPNQPVSSSYTAEIRFHPELTLERSNLNVDEFLLEAEAQENRHLSLWEDYFRQTAFSSHMDELDFNTATPAGKLSTETLCSLATTVLQQMANEKGVKTIECLTLPCVSLSFMQNVSQKIAGVVPPSLCIKEIVIPFTKGKIPNERVQAFSITAVAENLSTCHPLCLSFVATDQSTPLGNVSDLKEKLANSMGRRNWNPKITFCVYSPEGNRFVTTLTHPPYSNHF